MAHAGSLDTYFGDVLDLKPVFLQGLHDLLDDNIPRYFVPEVNSNDDDLHSIVADLTQIGFTFTNPNQYRV